MYYFFKNKKSILYTITFAYLKMPKTHFLRLIFLLQSSDVTARNGTLIRLLKAKGLHDQHRQSHCPMRPLGFIFEHGYNI